MRIPYGFTLTNNGTLEINRSEADNVALIFDFYMASASLGKVADMLFSKQIPSPTGKAKWTRAAVDHLLSNGKYVAIIGLKKFLDVQFEKAARCNIFRRSPARLAEKKYALCFAYYASELIHLLYFCALCYNDLKR